MSPQLGLDYAPTMNHLVLGALEQTARQVGLPLWQVELLGQDADVALAFTDAVADGSHDAFLAELDWDKLEACLHHREIPAVPLL